MLRNLKYKRLQEWTLLLKIKNKKINFHIFFFSFIALKKCTNLQDLWHPLKVFWLNFREKMKQFLSVWEMSWYRLTLNSPFAFQNEQKDKSDEEYGWDWLGRSTEKIFCWKVFQKNCLNDTDSFLTISRLLTLLNCCEYHLGNFFERISNRRFLRLRG